MELTALKDRPTLKEARTSKGMTQQELADLVGVRQNYLSDLEAGNRNPSDETRIAISNVLGDVIYVGEQSSGDKLKKIVTKGTAIVPLYRTLIKAGNGGQVLEDTVEQIDIAEHYRNTCVYEVSGDSMINAKIEEGDRIVVKLGYLFKNRDIILCRYNGELMLKGAAIVDGAIWLFPANKHYRAWKCKPEDEFQCIGVMVEKISKPNREWWGEQDFNKLK